MIEINNGALTPKILPLSLEFGGMTTIKDELLFPNSSILEYLPEQEAQIGVYFGDWGCVSRSLLNGLEAIISKNLVNYKPDNRRFLLKNFYKNDKPNFSDRDLVVLSGTKVGKGNSGEVVLDTARIKGIIPEDLAPWDFRERNPEINSQEKYFLYKRSKEGELIASELNKRFEIVGEWVSKSKLKEAMKYGAVQVYVNAWFKNAEGKYYNPTGKTNHAVLACNYDDKKIFDSFDPYIKELSSWDDIYPVALKINFIEKTMEKPKLENNTLVQLVEGLGGFGMYLDGVIYIDDTAKILASVLVRNNGKLEGKIKALTQEKWDLFDKKNLKGDNI